MIIKQFFAVSGLSLCMLFFACDTQSTQSNHSSNKEGAALSGVVKVDGSSTVFPITEAMAEEFRYAQPKVKVTVGLSGTGGGMKKFIEGVVDITGASRPIKASEKKLLEERKVEFNEVAVAYDGIAVVVSHKNTFAKELTVEQLKKLWQPESKVKLWSDLNPAWPKKAIKLYGPGVDSGTFDYFTKTIMGKSGATRSDFTASEDDNVLVQGVASDEFALAYFGFAYWSENKNKLNRVAVDNGKGGVLPSRETIENASYAPLSRPVFVYVRKSARQNPAVKAFVDFYIESAYDLVPQVGYVPFSKETYSAVNQRWQEGVAGTSFNSELAKTEKSVMALVQHKP